VYINTDRSQRGNDICLYVCVFSGGEDVIKQAMTAPDATYSTTTSGRQLLAKLK
jgi:hypothetical protein